MSSSRINADLKKWIEKVRKATTPMGHKKVLRKGAKVIQDEMKRIIKSEASHTVYTDANGKTRKRYNIIKRYKKGGGGGMVARYHKGNLARSIRIMTFKRSQAVFIGTRLKGGESDYKGRTVDGYYAHMVNNGTSKQRGIFFKERAQKSKERQAKSLSINEAKKVLNTQARKYGIK